MSAAFYKFILLLLYADNVTRFIQKFQKQKRFRHGGQKEAFGKNISSRDNFEADFEIRHLELEEGYALLQSAFRDIKNTFGRSTKHLLI